MSARLTYIGQGLRGHRARFVLVVAFVTFGMLLLQLNAALNNAFSIPQQAQTDRRLLVVNGVSPQMSLPDLYAGRIADVEGVAAVTHAAWVGAYFREPAWVVPALAVQSDTFFTLNPSLHVPPQQFAEWKQTRDGILVDQRFADMYKLSIGDRVPLQSSIWQIDNGGMLDLRIVGMVTDDKPENRPGLYFNYEFFESSRLNGKGLTSYFIVDPGPQADDAVLSRRIDALFADDRMRGVTQTAPMQAHMRQFAARLFEFGRAIGFVSGCICLLLAILLAANLYVIAQKSLADYQVFYRLGFTRRWVITTAFWQLASYIICGVVLSVVLGQAALYSLRGLTPLSFANIHLYPADYLWLVAIGVALTVLCTASALGRLVFKGFSQ
jgi:putative ABC transport system permease protein